MTVRLTEADLRKLTEQALVELNAYHKAYGYPETSWLSDLDPLVVALEAQRKLFRELEEQAKFNISAISQLDLFNSPMWQNIRKELEI